MASTRMEEELLKEKEGLIKDVLIDINNQDLMEKAVATQYGPKSFSLLDEQALRRQLIIGTKRSQWVKAQEAKQQEIQPISAAIAYESTPKITESGFSFWKKATPSTSGTTPTQEIKTTVIPKK